MEAAKETASNVWTSTKRALSSAPPNDAYLPWDAQGVEQLVPDEEAKTHQVADIMNRMQRHNFDQVRMSAYSSIQAGYVCHTIGANRLHISTVMPSGQLTSSHKVS